MKYMNATELLGFLKKAGLSCSKTSLQRMVRERKIPYYTLPLTTSPPKFLDADIEEWLKKQRVSTIERPQRRSRI